MNPEYDIANDPAFEKLKLLPGGQGIYDYVRNKSEQLAVAVDTSVNDIIERHELPRKPEELREMGYQIVVEIFRLPDGTDHRRTALYKKVDEVKVVV
jgi:hypothetical protein